MPNIFRSKLCKEPIFFFLGWLGQYINTSFVQKKHFGIMFVTSIGILKDHIPKSVRDMKAQFKVCVCIWLCQNRLVHKMPLVTSLP